MMVLLIIVAALLVVFLFNEYYYWVVCDFTQDYHMRKGEKGAPYDAIAFGSAYCRYGLDFSSSGLNGYNFGYSSQFFFYTNLMLNQYAKTCKKGGIVYLIIADMVFAKVGKGIYGAEEYVKFLNKSTLREEYSYSGFLKSRLPVLMNPRLIVGCVKHICGKTFPNTYKNLNCNELSESQVKEAADKRCKSWCKQFGLTDTISDRVPKELEETFVKTRQILTGMIQLCLDKGLKPVLVVMPVSKIMNDRLSDAFLECVLFDNIRKANTQQIPFLNYLRDERFADYKLYHNNADFLNATGRKMFTEILVADTQI